MHVCELVTNQALVGIFGVEMGDDSTETSAKFDIGDENNIVSDDDDDDDDDDDVS